LLPFGDATTYTPQTLDAEELKAVAGADLFTDIPRAVLETVLPRCQIFETEAGVTLIERGHRNEYVFLVLRGSLRVQLDDAPIGQDVVLRPGECAGEVSVIDGRGATASVTTAERARLLRIDRETLWYLVGTTEVAARNLLLIFSGRMRRENDLLLTSLGQRRELERVASIDGLTGLKNRRWLDHAFARQLERCARADTTASLLFADVDNFKEFNDRYGHLTGDRALQHVAAVLLACLRPTGLIARYGGEEFAVLLPGTALEQALLVAERGRDRPIEQRECFFVPHDGGFVVVVLDGVERAHVVVKPADAEDVGRGFAATFRAGF